MSKNSLSPGFLVITLMIVSAAFVRLIPHPPNFAPIAAMALFGGAYFNKKWAAFLIPLAAMFVTDLFLGFHATMWAVYLCFALIVVLGMIMIKQKKIGNIFFASVIASVSFFVITNFGVWISTPFYEKTSAGLAACYTAAIPFFHQTLLSDLFFVAILFGLYELAKTKFPQLAKSNI
ncbi:MAG: hypothetical protein KJN64_13700 [Ignavibacteria bacterium]|nr:hypothetical protein [Ignavibacteria bacterium]MBT8382807.1 hypothetical protein [Ignavibacteria bacterium]MBT8392694.1 hypothetical protein [Ignavibacteria bacterium]NNJ52526.1 hypothetical protein [Ignavibacteriaceae bacterium]NNL21971.1 hypothetical protein [Ignavibacteriaceae bacterium]